MKPINRHIQNHSYGTHISHCRGCQHSLRGTTFYNLYTGSTFHYIYCLTRAQGTPNKSLHLRRCRIPLFAVETNYLLISVWSSVLSPNFGCWLFFVSYAVWPYVSVVLVAGSGVSVKMHVFRLFLFASLADSLRFGAFGCGFTISGENVVVLLDFLEAGV